MPMRKMAERDIFPGYDGGIVVAVAVLEDDGSQARIRVEDSGVQARQGQIHTVASSDVRMWWEDV